MLMGLNHITIAVTDLSGCYLLSTNPQRDLFLETMFDTR